MIKKFGQKWKVDVRPEGKYGKRVIRLFDSKADANAFERKILTVGMERRDNRKLSELIELWYQLHGVGLNSGVDTKNRLLRLSASIGDPVAKKFDVRHYADYRSSRLESGIKPGTLNRELSTLKTHFRELKRLGVIDYESPIFNVRKLKESETELSYLTHDQIKRLWVSIDQSRNDSLIYVTNICLLTGARWSEAETLSFQNCVNGGFYFTDTKNGKTRFVPVDEFYYRWVKDRLLNGRFDSCYSAFRSAFHRAGLKTPAGQLAHVLRHTFASHFVMNGGNIRSLQKILGHSSLQMTMRYSHLSPDFMNQARLLNPIATLKNNAGGKNEER